MTLTFNNLKSDGSSITEVLTDGLGNAVTSIDVNTNNQLIARKEKNFIEYNDEGTFNVKAMISDYTGTSSFSVSTRRGAEMNEFYGFDMKLGNIIITDEDLFNLRKKVTTDIATIDIGNINFHDIKSSLSNQGGDDNIFWGITRSSSTLQSTLYLIYRAMDRQINSTQPMFTIYKYGERFVPMYLYSDTAITINGNTYRGPRIVLYDGYEFITIALAKTNTYENGPLAVMIAFKLFDSLA